MITKNSLIMSVKFTSIAKGQPGVKGGGQKKYYATAVTSGELDLDGLTKLIEKSSTVNGADIRAVLYAMVDTLVDNLANGEVVRMGELGSLRLSISSEGKEKEEDVSASSIVSSKVIFTPGKKIKNMLKTVEFRKA